MSDHAQANICEPHHFVWTWPINDPGHGSIGVCELCGAVKVDECRPARPAMTGDDLAEKVAAVLPDALHAADDLPDDCSPEDVFRAVAAALLPLIREREAAAKAEVYDEAAAEFWRIFLRLPQTPSPLGDYVQRRHQGFKGQAIALRAANPYAGSEGA